MKYTALVTLLLVCQFVYFTIQVGRARIKSGIKAPATSGDPWFERNLRVQMNSIEQLLILLPSLWLCAWFFSDQVAAGLGAVFLLARFVYAHAYVREPSSRSLGFALGMLANLGLILCALYGVLTSF